MAAPGWSPWTAAAGGWRRRTTESVRAARGPDPPSGRAPRWCPARLLALAGDLPATAGTVLVLGAAVALTVGEIWQAAGGWGLSYEYAPERHRATYLSIYNLGVSATAVAGPALLTTAVVERATPGWLGLAAVFLAAGGMVPRLVRRRAARSAAPATEPVGWSKRAGRGRG